jgi:hypothetical protein
MKIPFLIYRGPRFLQCLKPGDNIFVRIKDFNTYPLQNVAKAKFLRWIGEVHEWEWQELEYQTSDGSIHNRYAIYLFNIPLNNTFVRIFNHPIHHYYEMVDVIDRTDCNFIVQGRKTKQKIVVQYADYDTKRFRFYIDCSSIISTTRISLRALRINQRLLKKKRQYLFWSMRQVNFCDVRTQKLRTIRCKLI